MEQEILEELNEVKVWLCSKLYWSNNISENHLTTPSDLCYVGIIAANFVEKGFDIKRIEKRIMFSTKDLKANHDENGDWVLYCKGNKITFE